jgi:hypothetical protein
MIPTKTGRRRGVITGVIRNYAAAHHHFTLNDLPLAREVAKDNCHTLVTRGELVIVQKGIPGKHKSRPTVYCATARLRLPPVDGRSKA